MNSPPLIEAQALTRVYGRGSGAVRALNGVDLALLDGRVTAIMGPSGSGKSTLLQLLAGLDVPTSGRVRIGGEDINSLSARGKNELLRRCVGFVFQRFNLIPTLTARENITLPLALRGSRVDADWMEELIGRLDLGHRLKHYPDELSGGQQQRVAIARALVGRPAVVFADEPTGSLDRDNAERVLTLLRGLCSDFASALVVVTHDARVTESADYVVSISDGRITSQVEHRVSTSGDTIQRCPLTGGGR